MRTEEQTDRHDKATSRSSQLRKTRLKRLFAHTALINIFVIEKQFVFCQIGTGFSSLLKSSSKSTI